MEQLSGGFAAFVLVLATVIAVTWIAFPFLLLSRISRLQKTLDGLATTARAQLEIARDQR